MRAEASVAARQGTVGSLATVDGEDVTLVRANHPHEVFVRVPGVWISRGSGQEHLTAIRSGVLAGPGACGGFLLLENGIPIRPAGFCNVNNLFEMNTEQAAAVEVVRGPASGLFGGNALHGVVNVVTGAATDGWRGSVEAGPYEYIQGRLAGGGERGGIALLGTTSGRLSRRHGIRPAQGRREPRRRTRRLAGGNHGRGHCAQSGDRRLRARLRGVRFGESAQQSQSGGVSGRLVGARQHGAAARPQGGPHVDRHALCAAFRHDLPAALAAWAAPRTQRPAQRRRDAALARRRRRAPMERRRGGGGLQRGAGGAPARGHPGFGFSASDTPGRHPLRLSRGRPHGGGVLRPSRRARRRLGGGRPAPARNATATTTTTGTSTATAATTARPAASAAACTCGRRIVGTPS